MISLIPSWAIHNEEFWNAIKKRNLWFIKLRYGAVVLLTFLLVGLEFILKLPLSGIQLYAIIIITILILFYNIIIQFARPLVKTEGRFNNLHLSLIQMILDLIALTLLIHYTGGIENPLYMFYIFHMIIGSLILPGVVIYSLAAGVVISFSSIVFLEYYGALEHHSIVGLFSSPIYNNENYILIVLTIFILMMLVSVVLANKIARQLYIIEQQLSESLDKLNEAEKVKQKYVMGVVHEIKTPIAAVQSIIELILDKYLGPISKEVEERLIRIKARSDEAIKLINNVLHISKLKLLDEIAKEEVNIIAVVKNLLLKQKSVAEAKKVQIIFNNNCQGDVKIFGDAVLLEMAISNILNNSLKYVNAEGMIEINTTCSNESCTIKISDNGIGIPEKDQQKIFDEFYRASNIQQKDYEGTGLGLSLVRQIIKNHNGEISVQSPSHLQSENHPGTTFVLKIPIEK
jgi:signal transduction histidine kinase